MKYISDSNIKNLLRTLKENYEVYIPVKKCNQRFYRKYTEFSDDIVIGEIRTFEPLKVFFTRAREIVAEDFKTDIPHSNGKPFAILGVKACDLKGFKIQDYVFSAQSGFLPDRWQAGGPGRKNHDYQDPFYIKMREKNLIISADCTLTIDTCFCLALGIKPHPVEGFDINLSQIKGGFIVEVGSQKGSALVDRYSSLFQEAREEFISRRDKQRLKIIEDVEDNIKENDIPRQDLYRGVIEKKYESDIWKDEAKTCVECGACNTICPTCHCFLLYDQKNEEAMARLRIWDSCMIKDFAKVAGGANPRPKLWMRLRNRFEKKFDFFPKLTDVYACTGCGRCISACPAKIDIRKVLKRLVSDA